MEAPYWIYYIIGINVVGFISYLVNIWLYTYTPNGEIDKVLTIVVGIGGALGIVLAILLFDPEAKKFNMMSRVYVFSVLVIQIALFLFLRSDHSDGINLAFWDFFLNRKWMLYYLLGINVLTFILFGVDKHLAIQGKAWRIRIITLLGFCALGGSIGSLIGMYVFRHKNKQDYFTQGIPLIMIAQAALMFYLMNR